MSIHAAKMCRGIVLVQASASNDICNDARALNDISKDARASNEYLGSHYKASELIPYTLRGLIFQKQNRKEEEEEG